MMYQNRPLIQLGARGGPARNARDHSVTSASILEVSPVAGAVLLPSTGCSWDTPRGKSADTTGTTVISDTTNSGSPYRRLMVGRGRGREARMGGPFWKQERGTDALVAPVLRPLFYNSFLFYYLYPYHSGPIARA